MLQSNDKIVPTLHRYIYTYHSGVCFLPPCVCSDLRVPNVFTRRIQLSCLLKFLDPKRFGARDLLRVVYNKYLLL